MRLFIFIIIFLVQMASANSQPLLGREKELSIVERAMFHVYNMQYDSAQYLTDQLKGTLIDHPGYYLLQSMLIYWKHYPITPDTKPFEDFENLLLLTAEKAQMILNSDKNQVEGTFFSLAAYGYLTYCYAEEGNLLKTINYAKKAYGYLKDGIDQKENYDEFYFTTGLYNYYREKYPEIHTFYKPFMWFFKSGDKSKGIKQLEIAAKEATYTNAEALYYLFHIQLRYEQDPEKALQHSNRLVEKFPGNSIFKIYKTENLLFTGDYTSAIALIKQYENNERDFYKLTSGIFNAMIEEKFFKKFESAIKIYENALDRAEGNAFDIDHYLSLAYAGIARSYHELGNRDKAEENYKKCRKLAKYDIVFEEAESYL